jgi:hypothetical protein
MAEGREVLVNLRNHMRGEVDLSECATAVRADSIVIAGQIQLEDLELKARAARQQAGLEKLKQLAAQGDETALAVLDVLGLE